MTTHTFASIFKDDSIQRNLSLFSPDVLAAIEASIFDKNGKATLKCLATGKDRAAKPEEIVRQLWLYRLIHHYGYPAARITIEYPVTFGRDTSKRADIVIFDAQRATVPYIIIEVKQTKLKDGKDQLRSYCHATGAPLALWSDGSLASTYHRKNPNCFIEIPDLPTASQTIEDIVNEPWTLDTLIAKEKSRERNKSLKQIILEMEDVDMVIAAKRQIEDSVNLYAQAEQTLLAELGLLDWRPPEPLTYQCKASEVLRAGRFDSEHFQPKYAAVEQQLYQYIEEGEAAMEFLDS